jgi:hypothetical protein
MERRIGRFDQPGSSAESQTPGTPIEGLIVRRDRLIRFLKDALGERHDHLREIAGTAAALEELQTIKYWENVLLWVKWQQGSEMVLLERKDGHP